jgi:hypothetical protein
MKPIMRRLNMGPEFKLPLDAQTQTLIVYGSKGMGKTNAAAVLAEELFAAHLKFAAIDPMGVLWGLKHNADPAGPGLDVLILGGTHGDIPIEPTAGAVVADLVVDENISTVIDISRRPDGKMWKRGERIKFVADYATRLYERQGERMRPLMQIIDEAARFCPQTIPHGAPELSRCVGAVEQLVEEGRNVGVGVSLITQRSARMNKSVSELADCMLAFRTIGPNSVAAILDWFGEHVPKERWKHLVERLRALPRGTALVVSPGWLQFEGEVAIRQRWTLDTSATPTDGRRRTMMKRELPKEQLDKYTARMAETIARVQADDPRVLRSRIVELERQLKSRPEQQPQPAAKPAEPIRVNVPVFDADARREMTTVMENLQRLSERIGNNVMSARGLVDALPKRIAMPDGKRVGFTDTALPFLPTARGPRTGGRSIPRDLTEDAGAGPQLKKGAREMLRSLASLYPRPLTRVQIATLSGLVPFSGTYASYMSALRTAGFIINDESGTGVELTDAGRAFVAAGGLPPRPTSSAELIALWSGKLKAGARRMLDVLVASYPSTVGRGTLASGAGMEPGSGTFASYLSSLRSNGLVTDEPHGLRASEGLFLGDG